ncbi:hypothetical protein [Desertivirga arenae]|uniref:hypothetical protein n=1 Tax=Desertivirga arenae TaxID=2810309 RepID=UPI001A967CD8|nr:hypothetical protein [Pedobacter sp. SYSU D00823]
MKYIILTILPVVLLFTSCSRPPEHAVTSNSKFETLRMPSDSTTLYFRTKSETDEKTSDALDTFRNQWYSEMLFSLKEPVLYNYKGDKEIYRFTWLRTFHHPVAVRLEKEGEEIKLFLKVCDGAGGYKPGTLLNDKCLAITVDSFSKLKKKIDKADFWKQPTLSEERLGTDGSEWIIEGIKDNNYHLVRRWTPVKEEVSGFRAIGEYLIELSELGEKETEKFY